MSDHDFDSDDDNFNVIEERITSFLNDAMRACDQHATSSSNDVYPKRLRQASQLSALITELDTLSGNLRCLHHILAVLPMRDLESKMKGFARTRTFRLLAETISAIAEAVEALEDDWNDMNPNTPPPGEGVNQPAAHLGPPRQSAFTPCDPKLFEDVPRRHSRE